MARNRFGQLDRFFDGIAQALGSKMQISGLNAQKMQKYEFKCRFDLNFF